MQVVFESAIARDATRKLEAIVERSVADRHLPEEARVYISRPRSGWSVFVFGVEEHPLHLAERIRAALLREAPEESARHAPLRRLREV